MLEGASISLTFLIFLSFLSRFSHFSHSFAQALQMIMDVEPDTGRQLMHETGRLPHRYSYGSSAATRQQSA